MRNSYILQILQEDESFNWLLLVTALCAYLLKYFLDYELFTVGVISHYLPHADLSALKL